MYTISTPYGTYDVTLKWGYYANGRPALELLHAEDGDPVMVCTVNLPEVHLSEGETIIKDYSENEGCLDFLQKNGIVGPVKRMVRTGFVQCPIVDIL